MFLFSFVLKRTERKNKSSQICYILISLLSVSWTSWVRGNSRWRRKRFEIPKLCCHYLNCSACVLILKNKNASSHWKKLKLFSAMRRDCFAFISFLDFVNFLSFLIL